MLAESAIAAAGMMAVRRLSAGAASLLLHQICLSYLQSLASRRLSYYFLTYVG